MRTVRKHTHTHTCRYLSATVACGTTKLPRSCWVASGWANVMWGNWISFLPNLPWSCPEGWPLRQRASFSALALIFCFDPYFSTFDVLCLLFVSRLVFFSIRAPEPCTGAGEEGGPVTVRRAGYHVWGRAAVWGVWLNTFLRGFTVIWEYV